MGVSTLNEHLDTHITLIGELLAQQGNQFVFLGETTNCSDCRLRGACLRLEINHLYEIHNVRDAVHPCKGVFAGKVRTVDVYEPLFDVALMDKIIIEGATVTFKKIQCTSIQCTNWNRTCNPFWLSEGEKLKVEAVSSEKIKCKDGNELQIATVKRLN